MATDGPNEPTSASPGSSSSATSTAEPLRGTPPPPPSPPPTLEPAEFLKRIESAQSAINKSLLALLGLVAFWLAIENSYFRYVKLETQRAQLGRLDGVRSSYLQELRAKGYSGDNQPSARVLISPSAARSSAVGKGPATVPLETADGGLDEFCANPSSAKPSDVRAVKELCQGLSANRASRSRVEEKIEKLQEEPLDLSILGTKLPSRLAIAAEVWLVALLVWLNYFEAKRSAAHRHLAALHLRLPACERAFGKVPGAALWFGPLPPKVQVLVPDGPSDIVLSPQLRNLLGWTDAAEVRQAWALRGLMLVLLLAVARLGYIALDLTTDNAADRRFIAESWQLPLSAVALALSLLCAFRVVRLAIRRPALFDGSDLPVLTRRAIALDMLAVVGSVAVAPWLRPKAWDSLKLSGLMGNSANRRPRFRARNEKVGRKANREIVVKVGKTLALVFSAQKQPVENKPTPTETRISPMPTVTRPKGRLTLHAVDENNDLRLLNPLRSSPNWTAMPLADLERHVKDLRPQIKRKSNIRLERTRGLPSPSLNRQRTWPFEVLALGLISRGRSEEACKYLLIGAQLALLTTPGQPVNLRLLDLLAGLAVRNGWEGSYLKPLISSVAEHIKAFGPTDRLDGFPTPRKRTRKHCKSRAPRPSRFTSPAASSPAVPAGRAPARPSGQAGVIHDLRERQAKWQQAVEKVDAKSGWSARWTDQTKPIQWHHPIRVAVSGQQLPVIPECKHSTGSQQVAVEIPAAKKS